MCISRTGHDARAVLDGIACLHARKSEWNVAFVENDFMSDLSSTKLRQALRSGEPVSEFAEEGVAAYISEHGLYRDE